GGRLLVSHPYGQCISVTDPAAARVTAILMTALELQDVALDAVLNHLYVTDTAGRLHVLDAGTGRTLSTLPGEGRIAVDAPHGRFYTGGLGSRQVRIFDAKTVRQTGTIASQALPVADPHGGGLYLVQSGVYLASLETMTVTRALSDTLPEMPGYSPNPAAVDAV